MGTNESIDAAKAALLETKITGKEYARRGQPDSGKWGEAFRLLEQAKIKPSEPLFFNGDFSTGDLSQWKDFHDAHLDRVPPGFQVIPMPGGGYMAKCVVTGAADSSQNGDASYLWQGGNYSTPYLSKGSDAWFRFQLLIPNGSDSRYPGNFTHSIISQGWNMFMEWHSAPNAGYSSYVGLWGSDPPVLLFRPIGGVVGMQKGFWIHEKSGGVDKPLQYNHFYDILVRQIFSEDPAVGKVEWYVDGVLQYENQMATLTKRTDGSVPGVSLQVGHYRGPSRTDVETVYVTGTKVGPTRSSVGG